MHRFHQIGDGLFLDVDALGDLQQDALLGCERFFQRSDVLRHPCEQDSLPHLAPRGSPANPRYDEPSFSSNAALAIKMKSKGTDRLVSGRRKKITHTLTRMLR